MYRFMKRGLFGIYRIIINITEASRKDESSEEMNITGKKSSQKVYLRLWTSLRKWDESLLSAKQRRGTVFKDYYFYL